MKFFIALLFTLIGIYLISEMIIKRLSQSDEFNDPDLIVFLGCCNSVDDPLLNDRLLKLLEAHRNFPTTPILISGNEVHKKEVSSVLEFIGEKIPANLIAQDPTSLRTRDTFEVIQKKFTSKKLILITNDFHFDRALALAHLYDFQAQGPKADINYKLDLKINLRERLARIKFLLDLLAIKLDKKS